MTAGLINNDDERWQAVLDSVPHDVYHLPEYAQLAAAEDNPATARAFYACDGDHRCLIPLVIRPIPTALAAPSDWLDAVSPYGYASPLLTHDSSWVAEAIKEFVNCCAANNIICVFLRFHPFFDLEGGWSEYGDLVVHGQVVYVDLTTFAEAIWSEMKAEHRTDIRKLLRLGFTTSVDEWELLDEFVELYRRTMCRLAAHESYLFSRQYFDNLRQALGLAVHLISVRSPEGVLAAAGLYTSVGGIAQAHLAGNAEEFRRLAPSKLMQHAAIEWAKADGCRILNLGGGLDCKEDLLFRFKAAFSPLRRDFSTARIVCDRRKYDALVAKSRDNRISPNSSNGYFPAYRMS